MKIKKGFVLHKVGEDNVVVAIGEASSILNGIIKLNSSGVYLWNQLEGGTEQRDLVKSLKDHYEISQEQAEHDVDAFLKTLTQVGCLEL